MSQTIIKHIVMFDFSPLKPEKTEELVNALIELSKLNEVLSFEYGTECNHEDSPLGFTHCFSMTFSNKETRLTYLNSKEHRDYEKKVIPYRTKVLVFDYAINKVK